MTAGLEALQRRIGGFPIELPAAAAMAFAVGLATMALPDWRFESAVVSSGLPALVSAAQPPLGTTARALVALLLAGLTFAGVWAGLRALDRRPAPTDFPAFRTADLHPDAPRRRPILAGAEFGAPADDLPPIETRSTRDEARVSEPMPSFLAPQPAEFGDFMHAPEEVDFEEIEAADVGEVAVQREFSAEPVVMPAFLRVQANAAEDGMAEDEEEAESESVTRLMARLETGLARQSGRMSPGAAEPARSRVRRALVDLDGTRG